MSDLNRHAPSLLRTVIAKTRDLQMFVSFQLVSRADISLLSYLASNWIGSNVDDGD